MIKEGENAKPLEMASYKDEDKLISYKNVRPVDTVAIKPAIYIADVERGFFVKTPTSNLLFMQRRRQCSSFPHLSLTLPSQLKS